MSEGTTDIDRNQRDAIIAEIRRDDAYKALGVFVYEMAKRGQISDPRIAELTERIDQIINGTVSCVAGAREKTGEAGAPVDMEGAEGVGDAERPGEPELSAEQEEQEALLIICPHCGEEAEEGSAFCLFCGKNIEEVQFQSFNGVEAIDIQDTGKGQEQRVLLLCPHCGDELEEDAVFCITCGRETAAQPESGGFQEKPASAPERDDSIGGASDQVVTAIVETKTCPHCGDELEEGTVFCLYCGKKADED